MIKLTVRTLPTSTNMLERMHWAVKRRMRRGFAWELRAALADIDTPELDQELERRGLEDVQDADGRSALAMLGQGPRHDADGAGPDQPHAGPDPARVAGREGPGRLAGRIAVVAGWVSLIGGIGLMSYVILL